MASIMGTPQSHMSQRKCGTTFQQTWKNGFDFTRCLTNSVFACAA